MGATLHHDHGEHGSFVLECGLEEMDVRSCLTGRRRVAWTCASVDARGQKSNVTEEEGSDAAWQNTRQKASEPPKEGFLQEYMSALREQVKNNKNGR